MGASCILGNHGLIFNSLGGFGPLTQSAVALPAFREGKGTHLYLNDFADSRIHTGSIDLLSGSEDSDPVR